MAHGRNEDTVVDGTELRRLRVLGGMTLRALAERCEGAGQSVKYSQLSKIEREICQPRPQLLLALTKALSQIHGEPVNILKPAEEVKVA